MSAREGEIAKTPLRMDQLKQAIAVAETNSHVFFSDPVKGRRACVGIYYDRPALCYWEEGWLRCDDGEFRWRTIGSPKHEEEQQVMLMGDVFATVTVLGTNKQLKFRISDNQSRVVAVNEFKFPVEIGQLMYSVLLYRCLD